MRLIISLFMLLSSATTAAAPPRLIAAEQWCPTGIALDDRFVYWTNCGSGTIMRAKKSGGPVTVLANGQDDPIGIAVDASYIYWINWSEEDHTTGSVMKLSKRGGAPILLADAANLPIGQELVIDEQFVYYARGDEVVRVKKSGGTVTRLANGLRTVMALAQDAKDIYVAAADSNKLVRIPKDGGTPQVLAAPDVGSPQRLVLDETSVYYTVNSWRCGLFRVPKMGGATTQVVPDDIDPWVLGLVGSTLILRATPSSPKQPPGLLTMPKTGGRAIQVAVDVAVSQVISDGKAIYFTEGGGKKGTVRSVPLP
jgi:hypothetical protein